MVCPGYPGDDWHTHLLSIMQHAHFPKIYQYKAEKDCEFMVPDGEVGADADALKSPDFRDLCAILRLNGFKVRMNYWGRFRFDPVGDVPGEVVGM